MPYTNVPKPTGTPYTGIGKASGDIPTYGSAIYGTSRYGILDAYTDIAKPSNSVGYRGMTQGLLMPLTIPSNPTASNPYTNINKPT